MKVKLSSLIKIGAQHTEPLTCNFYLEDDDQEYTCVIGAAAWAMHFAEGYDIWRDMDIYRNWCKALERRYPILCETPSQQQRDQLPEELRKDFPYQETQLYMFGLNDNYGWSRQRIADWLALEE